MDRDLIDEKTEEAWQKLQAGDPGWFLWFNNNGTRTLADLTMQALIARLAATMAKDAARYRWLAAYARSTSEHWGGRWSLVIDGPAPKSHDSEDDLDEAIDAAIAKSEGTQEKQA